MEEWKTGWTDSRRLKTVGRERKETQKISANPVWSQRDEKKHNRAGGRPPGPTQNEGVATGKRKYEMKEKQDDADKKHGGGCENVT